VAALPQEWPFCWWVVVVLDHFSRRVQGFAVFEQKPDARALCAFLGRTIGKVGEAPLQKNRWTTSPRPEAVGVGACDRHAGPSTCE